MSSTNKWGKYFEYEIPEGKFTITYSTGKFMPETKNCWNLDDGVIYSLDFRLNKTIDKLELKLNDLKKNKEYDDKMAMILRGIDGKIEDITLRVKDKQLKPC